MFARFIGSDIIIQISNRSRFDRAPKPHPETIGSRVIRSVHYVSLQNRYRIVNAAQLCSYCTPVLLSSLACFSAVSSRLAMSRTRPRDGQKYRCGDARDAYMDTLCHYRT